MPWNRHDPPDPLEARRRELAEQERQLAQQRQRLSDELRGSGQAPPAKPVEPPIWRLEDDSRHARAADPTPARKRHLARQRQRDMALFFIFIVVLLIVLAIVFIVAYVHNTTPVNGA
jgi:hypothetical protein